MTSCDDVFVGRAHELATLDAALTDVVGGRGRMVLVGGEPGIGKTRLLAEYRRRVPAGMARVLVGRCHEGGNARPLRPWLEILRGYEHAADPDEVRDLLPPIAGDATDAAVQGGDLPPDVHAMWPATSGTTLFRVFDAVTSLLETAAHPTPLVLLLDDVHWADAASLRLLAFAAARLRTARILIVATYRSSGAATGGTPESALRDLVVERAALHLELGPLEEAAAAALISAMTGRPHGPEVVAWLQTTADGHPLFLRELVSALMLEQRIDDLVHPPAARPPLPARVQALVRIRLESLSARCRVVLALAATIGREFDLSLLQAASGELTSHDVSSALEEAAAAGIVVRDASHPGRERFSQALVRETVYDTIPFGERT